MFIWFIQQVKEKKTCHVWWQPWIRQRREAQEKRSLMLLLLVNLENQFYIEVLTVHSRPLCSAGAEACEATKTRHTSRSRKRRQLGPNSCTVLYSKVEGDAELIWLVLDMLQCTHEPCPKTRQGNMRRQLKVRHTSRIMQLPEETNNPNAPRVVAVSCEEACLLQVCAGRKHVIWVKYQHVIFCLRIIPSSLSRGLFNRYRTKKQKKQKKNTAWIQPSR